MGHYEIKTRWTVPWQIGGVIANWTKSKIRGRCFQRKALRIDGSISNRIRLSMLLCGHPGVKHGIQNIHPKTRSNNYNARERRDFPWEGGKSCLISHEPPYTIPIHYCSETRPPVEYFPSPQMMVTSLVLRDGGCRLIRSASMAGRRAREDYTASSHSALI